MLVHEIKDRASRRLEGVSITPLSDKADCGFYKLSITSNLRLGKERITVLTRKDVLLLVDQLLAAIGCRS